MASQPLRRIALSLALLAWPSGAWAEPDGDGEAKRGGAAGEESPARRWAEGGVLFALRPFTGNVGLGEATFSGEGVPAGGARREEVAFEGREAGYVRPTYFGGEIGVNALFQHVSIGLVVEFGGVSEANAPTASAEVARKIGDSAATFWGAALALGGYVWLGPALLRGEIYGGARNFSIGLVGYEPKSCFSLKEGKYPCNESASSALPIFQPRVSLDVAVVRLDKGLSLVAGPWAGLDVAPERAFSAGLSVGLWVSP